MAGQKYSVEMTKSTWKTKQTLETWPFLETCWLNKLPKIDLTTTKIRYGKMQFLVGNPHFQCLDEPHTHLLTWCVCCFVSLTQYWGIVTVPGSLLFRGPGVAGSSPFTLTMSLVTPVPSSSSSNGPTTTTLTTRGLCPGGSIVWVGPKFVRPHWWES